MPAITIDGGLFPFASTDPAMRAPAPGVCPSITVGSSKGTTRYEGLKAAAVSAKNRQFSKAHPRSCVGQAIPRWRMHCECAIVAEKWVE